MNAFVCATVHSSSMFASLVLLDQAPYRELPQSSAQSGAGSRVKRVGV